MRPRILVIDDDPRVLSLLATVLTNEGANVICEHDAKRGMEVLKSEPVDALFTDLRTSGRNGTEILREARAIQPTLPVVVITADGSIESTVGAFQSGAVEHFTKPFRAEQIVAALARAFAKSKQQQLHVSQSTAPSNGVSKNMPTTFVAASLTMRQVAAKSKQVAPSTLPVLIVGELGVGKERVARLIHSLSPRLNEPFVKLNCEAIQESQLVKMCYGEERVTDEVGDSSCRGLIERAAGGMLFLQNITGLPIWMQKVLLQSAQEGVFCRKGGKEPIPFRARIAASTRCDPADSVKKGVLLNEMHFYLNATPITLPPLRARREDIRPLVDTLVHEASCDQSLSDRRPALSFTEEALQLLEAYDWPGNIYELSNLIRRLCVFSSELEVTAAHVAAMLPSLPAHRDSNTITVPFVGDLKSIERAIVAEAINRARGNKSAAARSLGLHRKTLYRIIENDASDQTRRASG